MSEAKKILELIEKVSPDDTAALDEIDARVWAYVAKREFRTYCNGIIYCDYQQRSEYVWSCDQYFLTDEYTRSRDALKAIRPDGWNFSNMSIGGCAFAHGPNDEIFNCTKRHIPEELAELHVIVSAIEWERQNAK